MATPLDRVSLRSGARDVLTTACNSRRIATSEPRASKHVNHKTSHQAGGTFNGLWPIIPKSKLYQDVTFDRGIVAVIDTGNIYGRGKCPTRGGATSQRRGQVPVSSARSTAPATAAVPSGPPNSA